MRLTAPVGVILVLVAVAASPGVGRAAVCEGYQPVSFIYPAGGLTHVPTNTLIWVGDAWTDDGSTLELWEHNGDQIDVVETTIEAGRASVTVLRPTIELVHAAYRIVAVRPDGSNIDLSVFATDNGPEFDIPRVPALGGFEPLWESGEILGCGTFARVELRTRFEGRIMLVDILDSDDGTPDGDDDDSAGVVPFLDVDEMAGAVDAIQFEESYPDWFEIGRTNCIDNWPGAEPGAATQIRFAALEETGGFSGWGEWRDVSIPLDLQPQPDPVDPDPTDGGCSVVGGHASGPAILACTLAALAAMRRRWHHRRP